MGVLLPSFRRRVTATIAGRKQSSLETVASIQDGVLLSVKEGHENGSRIDGSTYIVANVQVAPGRVIHVAGYGEDQVKAIRDLAATGENPEFSAILRPTNRSWFKLAEFIPTDAPVEQTAA